MTDQYFIGTPVNPQSRRWATLLSILESVMPVKFGFSGQEQPAIAGNILVENGGGTPRPDLSSISSLTVPRGEDALPEGELIDFAIRFADETYIPFPFRGRSLRTKVSAQPTILSLSPDERPLATCDRGPVWAVSRGESPKYFRSGFALPALPANGSLQDVLSGRRFLEILPLLHWLRGICTSASAVDSSLRACFIFDDPNLHWPRYGYVDYRQLAAHAEKENYHVAFATIPLDTWFTHRETAGIFRQHRRRLSLLIHGNNHSKQELARPYTGSERVSLLGQAIQRIERLERRSGLAVSRVMVPPHGACSEEMLAALPLCGFEAACISHGSLRAHNKAKAWTKTLGYLPSELVRGCPVFPRWGVSGDLKNTILLAAYLHQAIILRGHHQDLKDGPDLLDELARIVNRLGSVKWLNMTDLVRSKHPENSTTAREVAGMNGSILMPSFSEAVDRKTAPGRETHPKSGASVWFIRRLLTEGRDRLLSTAGRHFGPAGQRE